MPSGCTRVSCGAPRPNIGAKKSVFVNAAKFLRHITTRHGSPRAPCMSAGALRKRLLCTSTLPKSVSHLRVRAFSACQNPISRRNFPQQSPRRKHLAILLPIWRQSDPEINLRTLRADSIESMPLPKGQRPSIVFPGGGIYFWWQAGAVKALQESCDLTNYSFAGASAGSLSAVFAASGVDMDEAYRSAHRLASENGICRMLISPIVD